MHIFTHCMCILSVCGGDTALVKMAIFTVGQKIKILDISRLVLEPGTHAPSPGTVNLVAMIRACSCSPSGGRHR